MVCVSVSYQLLNVASGQLLFDDAGIQESDLGFGQYIKVLYELAANNVQRLTFICVPCITSTQPQHRVAVYGSLSATGLLQAVLHCINHMLFWRGLQTSIKLSIIVEYFAIVKES